MTCEMRLYKIGNALLISPVFSSKFFNEDEEMYLFLLTMGVAVTALPVPEDSAFPDGHSPLIISAPESVLRTNVLAAFLLPADTTSLKHNTNDPYIQLIHIPDTRSKDIDATEEFEKSEDIKEIDKMKPQPNLPLFTSIDNYGIAEYEKELEANKATYDWTPQLNAPLFASGSGTFTLGDKEPNTLQPSNDDIHSDSSDGEVIWYNPDEEHKELSKPDAAEPIGNRPEESSEDKTDETPIEESTSIEEHAIESSPSIDTNHIVETPPTSEVHKPIILKPKPSIFSWRPSFFSFFYPDRYSSKLSLSSLPLLSILNLQNIPYISTVNLASSALASALPKVRSSSDHDSVYYLNNPDKSEMPYGFRYYMYVEPEDIK